MSDPLPDGVLLLPARLSAEQCEQVAKHWRDTADAGRLIIGAEGMQFHRVPGARWETPSPQDAFTLRVMMAAHADARHNLAQLRGGLADHTDGTKLIIGAGQQLAASARVEAAIVAIDKAEQREREARTELAEAHRRATGAALPDPVHPLRELREAQAQLTDAHQVERVTRGRLTELDATPGRGQRERARGLRVAAIGLAVCAALAGLAYVNGLAPLLLAAVAGMAVTVGIGAYWVISCTREISGAILARPQAETDYDVALRRLVAAEAGVIAAGGALVPTTLDAAATASLPTTG